MTSERISIHNTRNTANAGEIQDVLDARKYREACERAKDRANLARVAHEAWGSDPEGAQIRWVLGLAPGAPTPEGGGKPQHNEDCDSFEDDTTGNALPCSCTSRPTSEVGGEEGEPQHRAGCGANTGGPCTRSCEHQQPVVPLAECYDLGIIPQPKRER
jgi:hypothetical protein